MKNIIIFLNGKRGISTIEEILKTRHKISTSVIPTGYKFNKVEEKIKSFGLSCIRLSNVNNQSSIKKLKFYKPELFIVAGFSTIFKKNIIDIPTLGTINLHAGRLPEYRGGSPLNWQLINGEREAKISIIKLDSGIDTGPVLMDKSIKINKNTNISHLHDKANYLFPKIVIKTISKIEKDKKFKFGKTQNERKANYWHQRSDSDGYLDFKNLTAFEADRFVKALENPYPGAWAFVKNKKLRILKSEVSKSNIRGVSGRVCIIQKNVNVICKDKAIILKKYFFEKNNKLKLKNGQYLS